MFRGFKNMLLKAFTHIAALSGVGNSSQLIFGSPIKVTVRDKRFNENFEISFLRVPDRK